MHAVVRSETARASTRFTSGWHGVVYLAVLRAQLCTRGMAYFGAAFGPQSCFVSTAARGEGGKVALRAKICSPIRISVLFRRVAGQ